MLLFRHCSSDRNCGCRNSVARRRGRHASLPPDVDVNMNGVGLFPANNQYGAYSTRRNVSGCCENATDVVSHTIHDCLPAVHSQLIFQHYRVPRLRNITPPSNPSHYQNSKYGLAHPQLQPKARYVVYSQVIQQPIVSTPPQIAPSALSSPSFPLLRRTMRGMTAGRVTKV